MTKQEQQIQSFPLPWDRFWARCIDLILHYLISFSIYFFSGIGSYAKELMHQTGYYYLMMFIIVWTIVSVVFLLYESFFLSVFEATPGKALFHISVTGSDGKKLSFGAALVRAISLYWFGHYFFLFGPDVFVIGYWFSSRYYKKTGTFRWNKTSNSIVSQEPLTLLRRKLFILLAIFCITLRLVPGIVIAYKFLLSCQ
jgi:uncharacterized RDD family membrane protein YckC